jgi:hypothetical protein
MVGAGTGSGRAAGAASKCFVRSQTMWLYGTGFQSNAVDYKLTILSGKVQNLTFILNTEHLVTNFEEK